MSTFARILKRDTSEPRRGAGSRRKRIAAMVMATMMLTGIATAQGIVSPGSANAAGDGIGMSASTTGAHVGQLYTSEAGVPRAGYCIELGGANPQDEQLPKELGALRDYTMAPSSGGHYVPSLTNGAVIMHINYVMYNFGFAESPGWFGDGGALDDNGRAAAANIAIWQLRADETGGPLAALLNQTKAGLPQAVNDRAAALVADARTNAVSVADATAAAQSAANVQVAAQTPASKPAVSWTTHYDGSVSVPAGWDEISIASADGRFAIPAPAGVTFNAARTTATVTSGTVVTLKLEHLPKAGDGMNPTVFFSGKWAASANVSGGFGYPARVFGYEPASAQDQLLISRLAPEPVTATASDSGEWQDSVFPSPNARFEPVVTTAVGTVKLKLGDKYVDQVAFDVAAGSNPWSKYWTGSKWAYREVTATGTLYGPMKAKPNRASTIPTNPQVPVAATATLNAEGPGTYTASVRGDEADEPGFYTWVWQIDGAKQGSTIQTGTEDEWHIERAYSFRDDFGIDGETHVRPNPYKIVTDLADSELGIDQDTNDAIKFNVEGGWLESDGKRIPITLRSTVYRTDGSPEQQPNAPAESEILSSQKVTVSNPKDAQTLSAPVEIPFVVGGGITVQTCVLEEDQPAEYRNMIEEGCDNWGIPEESAVIVGPEVTTQAQKNGAVKGDVKDVAKITGPIPNAKAEIDFSLFLKPEVGQPKYDENWKPVLSDDGKPALWTQKEVADPATCEAQPVARTKRVSVTKEGDLDSPAVRAETAGTLYWVEELFVTNPETGEEISVHRGKCGQPSETTVVTKPKVTTKATVQAVFGDQIGDTGIVSGELSKRPEISYELTFEAYHRAVGKTTSPDEKLCTADTKVWESKSAVKVSGTGEYKSETFEAKQEHLGEILWVESLWEKEKKGTKTVRTLVERGKCGEKNEITRVVRPVAAVAAANTATDVSLIVGGVALGTLILSGAAITLLRSRTRAKAAAEAETAEVA